MEDFTQRSLDDFLDRVADATPTPGGGSVAATAGALACAIARMVAAYSLKPGAGQPARVQVEAALGRLRRADQLLRALISDDAAAYTNMTRAAKVAKTDPAAQRAYQETVLRAIAVPLETAAAVSSALATMDEFKAVASRYLLSDLGVAATLAQAAARAAGHTARVNLHALADDDKRAKLSRDIEQANAHCASRRDSIEAFVKAELEAGP